MKEYLLTKGFTKSKQNRTVDLATKYNKSGNKTEKTELMFCMSLYKEEFIEYLTKADLNSEQNIAIMEIFLNNLGVQKGENVSSFNLSILEILLIERHVGIFERIKNSIGILPYCRIPSLKLSFKNLNDYLMQHGFQKTETKGICLITEINKKFRISEKSFNEIYNKVDFWGKNFIIFCLIITNHKDIQNLDMTSVNLNQDIDIIKDPWLLALLQIKHEGIEKFILNSSQVLLLNNRIDQHQIPNLDIQKAVFQLDSLEPCIFKKKKKKKTHKNKKQIGSFGKITESDLSVIRTVTQEYKIEQATLNSKNELEIIEIIFLLFKKKYFEIIAKINYVKPGEMIKRYLKDTFDRYFENQTRNITRTSILVAQDFMWPKANTIKKISKVLEFYIEELEPAMPSPNQESIDRINRYLKENDINLEIKQADDVRSAISICRKRNIAIPKYFQQLYPNQESLTPYEKILCCFIINASHEDYLHMLFNVETTLKLGKTLDSIVEQLSILILRFPKILSKSKTTFAQLLETIPDFAKIYILTFKLIREEYFDSFPDPNIAIKNYAKKNNISNFINLSNLAESWSLFYLGMAFVNDQTKVTKKIKGMIKAINSNPNYSTEKKTELTKSLENTFPDQFKIITNKTPFNCRSSNKSEVKDDTFGPFYDIDSNDLSEIRQTMNDDSLTKTILNSRSEVEITEIIYKLYRDKKHNIIKKISYRKPFELAKELLQGYFEPYYQEKANITTSNMLVDPDLIWPNEEITEKLMFYMQYYISEHNTREEKFDLCLLHKANRHLQDKKVKRRINNFKDLDAIIRHCLKSKIDLPRYFFKLQQSIPFLTYIEASLCSFVANFINNNAMDPFSTFFDKIREVVDDDNLIEGHIITQVTILALKFPEKIKNSRMKYENLNTRFKNFPKVYLSLFSNIRFEHFRGELSNKRLIEFAQKNGIQEFFSLENLLKSWCLDNSVGFNSDLPLQDSITAVKSFILQNKDYKIEDQIKLIKSLEYYFPEQKQYT